MGSLSAFFVDFEDTVRLNFPDDGPLAGHWLQARTQLSGPEIQRLTGKLFRGMEQDDDSGKQTMIIDYAAADVEKIKAWVKRWSFPDRGGNRPLPVNDHTINRLTSGTMAAIIARLDDHIAEVEAADTPAESDPLPESSGEFIPTDPAAESDAL